MEQELIIAEILRNKPQGIKLYSPIFGDCTFCYVKDELSDICVRRPYNELSYFNFNGVYHTGGECLLFPSKEMCDWSKFAWKKGDVLVNENNAHIIFEKFSNDTYTTFIGKYYCDGDDKSGYSYISGRYTACSTHGAYHYTALSPQTSVYYGIPMFKNKDDAEYVITNPNFRSILDAIYKN